MSHKTLILTHHDVRALCDMPLAMRAVEAGFRAYAEGRARMPSKVYLDLPEYHGDFRAMPALLRAPSQAPSSGAYAGVKWVNAHPENGARFGLPTVLGTYVLSDPARALPLAIMDATLLTALRTGAAAGVATKYLAALPLSRVGFIGTGVQARMFRDALATLGPFELYAADRRGEAAQDFARESAALGFRAQAVALADAAACPVICIATPSSTPVIARAMVAPGAHINAMGADGPGKQELDPELLRAARIVVDEPEQSLHGGELNVPVSQGLLSERDIAATLGEVITGQKLGRRAPSDITVFDSTGLAIQDIALASALYERAQSQGIGVAVELVPAG